MEKTNERLRLKINREDRYRKRRLRKIDGRIRFFTKRIEAAELVDPACLRAVQAATSE